MNKKIIIIGLIVTGVVIGGLYLYKKRNKSSENKSSENKSSDIKKNMATEKDAIEIVDLISRNYNKPSVEYIKEFVTLYVSNIDKETHEKLKSILTKKESDWTTQDRLTSLILTEKVIKPVKTSIEKPKR